VESNLLNHQLDEFSETFSIIDFYKYYFSFFNGLYYILHGSINSIFLEFYRIFNFKNIVYKNILLNNPLN